MYTLLRWENLESNKTYPISFNNLEGRVNTYKENYLLKDSPIIAVLIISNPEFKNKEFSITFEEKDKYLFDSFKLVIVDFKYKEILKLEKLLKEGNIPYTIQHILNGYQINIPYKGGTDNPRLLCYAVEHFCSYGNEEDKLEIVRGLTAEEYEENESPILGGLTAEEVFKRFKYCYENNTEMYKQ